MSIKRAKPSLAVAKYTWSDARLSVERVNDSTWWTDPKWRYRGAFGGKDAIINWRADLLEKEWRSAAWQGLLSLGRRIICAETSGDAVSPPKESSLGDLGPRLVYFLKWMFRNHYYQFSDLTPQSLWDFASDVVDEKVGDEIDGDQVSHETLRAYLEVPWRIHRLAKLFHRLPAAVLDFSPYGGKSASALATQHVISSISHIPRLPAEVQNAILTETSKWVWQRATDILQLQSLFLAGRAAGAHITGRSYGYLTDRALLSFKFDRNGELASPWRPPLSKRVVITRMIHGLVRTNSVGPTPQFKYLQTDLRDSCVITIQSGGGMRISEIAELNALPRHPNGWPHCLVRKVSGTGLMELFFLQGKLVKGENDTDDDGHIGEVEWLVGSRPLGSNSLPDPVQAVLILDELFTPWRDLSSSKKLIVSLGRGKGPPRTPLSQPEVMRDTLRQGQISFVANHVTLPSEFKDWILSTHQWRKAFAEDVIVLNPHLLPAVQEQFKHINRAMTEQAYVGSEPYLLRMLAEQQSHATARAMYDIAYGGAVAVGQLAQDLDLVAKNIREFCRPLETVASRLDALEKMLLEEGLRVWSQEYGDCIFRARYSLCHMQEHGEIDRDAKRPLVVHRCCDLCSRCANLVVSKRHVTFWQDRLARNSEGEKLNAAAGELGLAAAFRERAAIAEQVLRRMGEMELVP